MEKGSRKKQEDLVALSRLPVINQLHSIRDSIVKKAPAYNMHGLVEENKLKWFFENLFHLGGWRYAYQHYSNPAINNGIFRMSAEPGNTVSIALLSDWASNTMESQNIAKLAAGHDYSIHLGDTYYVGNSREIADNFNNSFGGTWPYGKHGSFAMLGNHEMYSGGKSYFTELLPYMGTYTGENTNRQEASFFALENDHWRIIGLDTGYYSLTGWLGLKPNTSLKLHPKQAEWLKDTVQLNKDKRGIIFLSHHQPISAFEKEEYQSVIAQLAEFIPGDRTVLWFWGHEHRLAVYGHNNLAEKIQCFGRCIGNSGMPVETKHSPKSTAAADPANRNLVLYDNRTREIIGAISPWAITGMLFSHSAKSI
jgi:hypothetical protein